MTNKKTDRVAQMFEKHAFYEHGKQPRASYWVEREAKEMAALTKQIKAMRTTMAKVRDTMGATLDLSERDTLERAMQVLYSLAGDTKHTAEKLKRTADERQKAEAARKAAAKAAVGHAFGGLSFEQQMALFAIRCGRAQLVRLGRGESARWLEESAKEAIKEAVDSVVSDVVGYIEKGEDAQAVAQLMRKRFDEIEAKTTAEIRGDVDRIQAALVAHRLTEAAA